MFNNINHDELAYYACKGDAHGAVAPKDARDRAEEVHAALLNALFNAAAGYETYPTVINQENEVKYGFPPVPMWIIENADLVKEIECAARHIVRAVSIACPKED